jgi:antitoxin ParD1/3/4
VVAGPEIGYEDGMIAMTVQVPDEMQVRVDARLADGNYVDTGDYLRDLIRRDLDAAARREELRAMIAEGWASGIVERDASEVIAEIIAEDPDLRG